MDYKEEDKNEKNYLGCICNKIHRTDLYKMDKVIPSDDFVSQIEEIKDLTDYFFRIHEFLEQNDVQNFTIMCERLIRVITQHHPFEYIGIFQELEIPKLVLEHIISSEEILFKIAGIDFISNLACLDSRYTQPFLAVDVVKILGILLYENQYIDMVASILRCLTNLVLSSEEIAITAMQTFHYSSLFSLIQIDESIFCYVIQFCRAICQYDISEEIINDIFKELSLNLVNLDSKQQIMVLHLFVLLTRFPSFEEWLKDTSIQDFIRLMLRNNNEEILIDILVILLDSSGSIQIMLNEEDIMRVTQLTTAKNETIAVLALRNLSNLLIFAPELYPKQYLSNLSDLVYSLMNGNMFSIKTDATLLMLNLLLKIPATIHYWLEKYDLIDILCQTLDITDNDLRYRSLILLDFIFQSEIKEDGKSASLVAFQSEETQYLLKDILDEEIPDDLRNLISAIFTTYFDFEIQEDI